MSLDFLPEETILHIWEYVQTNKDIIALISTSRRFQKMGKTFGYIKSITVGMNMDFMNFIELYHKHNKFLQRLTIENMSNPTYLIPTSWPKEVIFNRCFMGNSLIDPPQSLTEILIIQDFNRTRNSPNILKINWNKLNKLRILDIYTTDIDFTGLDACKNLEIIRIDLDKKRLFPSFFAHMPKLHTIAVNCQSDTELHFVSNKLTNCFIPKKRKFTSESIIVPKKHLEIDFEYFNIQSLTINIG